MTANDFQMRVATRFPNMNSGVLAEIRNELLSYAEEDIYELWENFNREYSTVSAPHWGVFSKMAYKMGLKPKGQKSGPVQAYEYCCLKPIGGPTEKGGVTEDIDDQRWCMKRFHIGEAQCPQCETSDSSFWVITKPGSIIRDPVDARANVLRQYARPAVAHTKRKPGDGSIGDKMRNVTPTGLKIAVSPEELAALKLQHAADVIQTQGGAVDAEDADWIEQLTGIRPAVKAVLTPKAAGDIFGDIGQRGAHQ